jgi:predicted porin
LSKRTTAYFKTGTYNKYSLNADSVKTDRTSIGLRHTF